MPRHIPYNDICIQRPVNRTQSAILHWIAETRRHWQIAISPSPPPPLPTTSAHVCGVTFQPIDTNRFDYMSMCRCVDDFCGTKQLRHIYLSNTPFYTYYIVILYWPLCAVNVACSSRLSRRATITHHMWGKMVMHSIAAYIVKCCVSAWTLTDTRHTCTVQAAPVHLHEPRTRSARAHIIYTNVCGAFESVRIRRICQPIVISAWLNCIPFDRLLLPYIYATAANVSDSSP